MEDQAHSADLLRRGEVLAAITSDPTPVQGCRVTPLGSMRYRPAASPSYAERWRRGRGHDWATMPFVTVNEKDLLQHDLLAARGVTAPPVVHRVPTSDDFWESVRRGLGWGLLPEHQLLPGEADGSLVRLGSAVVDVPLHWMRWRLDSPALTRLGDAVGDVAGRELRRVRAGGAPRRASSSSAAGS